MLHEELSGKKKQCPKCKHTVAAEVTVCGCGHEFATARDWMKMTKTIERAMKQNPHFTAYIRSICKGPLLPSTVHNSILEGSMACVTGTDRIILWAKLIADVGPEEAKRLVATWIKKPWRLKA